MNIWQKFAQIFLIPFLTPHPIFPFFFLFRLLPIVSAEIFQPYFQKQEHELQFEVDLTEFFYKLTPSCQLVLT